LAIFLFSKKYALTRVDPDATEEEQRLQGILASKGVFQQYENIPMVDLNTYPAQPIDW
jgi:hypothetical protein